MNTADKNGRQWAKFSELKDGQTVEVDGGLTCREAGPAQIHSDAEGLYFECNLGRHYVDGQVDDGEHCVGIYPVAP
jgi:hypothetical protein